MQTVRPSFAVVETFLPYPACLYLFPDMPGPFAPSTPVLLQNWKVELPLSLNIMWRRFHDGFPVFHSISLLSALAYCWGV
jgi:hypothetical protein